MAACHDVLTFQPERRSTVAGMNVTLQYFDGCPSWRTVDERLRALADELDLRIGYQLVDSPEEAEAVGFLGSPTILIDGHDPFAGAEDQPGLACRVYETPEGRAGSPTIEQLRAALRTQDI